MSWLVWLPLSIVFVSAILVVCPFLLVPILTQIYPEIVWRANPGNDTIALSFDDGPDPVFTPRIAHILKEFQVPATFFVVGEQLHAHPRIAHDLIALGHELANHSGSWQRTLTLPSAHFLKDVERNEHLIRTFGPSHRLFRPAGIWIRPAQLRLLKAAGFRCILGSAYGHDPSRPPARYIRWAINRALRPGAIVVMHDSGGDRSRTIQALPGILREAHRRGLRFVLLSELLQQPVQTIRS
jgi:peptidoglycan/xylan/chitin deacetylase (PgdA/CDA1 family)